MTFSNNSEDNDSTVKSGESSAEVKDSPDMGTHASGKKVLENQSSEVNGDADQTVEPEEPVEMVEVPKTRLEMLEKAEELALEEVKRERANAINYRKRLEKQRDEFAEISSARVLSKVIEIKEDIKRILENGKEQIPKEHQEGIQLLDQRIQGIFESENVSILKIREGKTIYDPRYHEAILTTPNDDLPNNTILTEVNSGFIKGERVLRVAKVIISRTTTKPVEVKEEEEKTEASEKVEEDDSKNNEE